MTNKHFQALADAMVMSRPAPATSRYDQWLSDVAHVNAALILVGGPAFNSSRFADACSAPRKKAS